jgi:DNA polymerase-3 subunit delta'
MLFKQISGLDSTKQSLVAAVAQNHLAHAQLFCGPTGSGNLALAIAFATYLNCENRQADDACGVCGSCAKMAKLAHPDVHHIFPVASTKKIKENESDAFMPLWRKFTTEKPYGNLSDWLETIGVEGNKQGNISAEEARNVIKKVTLKAFEGAYKVLILWLPELLNNVSSNVLLKVLEEPPPNTIFLLVCNDANKLLATIISRTQRLYVPAFTETNIAQYLIENQAISQPRAKQIAYLANGNMTKAIALATEANADQFEWFAEWMRNCYKANIQDLVPRSDLFDNMKKETQKHILMYGLDIFRDLFLFQNNASALIKLEGNELTFVQNFAKAIQPNRIESIVKELGDAHFYLERNGRAKMIFLDASLSIAKLMKR